MTVRSRICLNPSIPTGEILTPPATRGSAARSSGLNPSMPQCRSGLQTTSARPSTIVGSSRLNPSILIKENRTHPQQDRDLRHGHGVSIPQHRSEPFGLGTVTQTPSSWTHSISLNSSIPIRAIRPCTTSGTSATTRSSLNPSIPIRAIRTDTAAEDGDHAARCISIPPYRTGQFRPGRGSPASLNRRWRLKPSIPIRSSPHGSTSRSICSGQESLNPSI